MLSIVDQIAELEEEHRALDEEITELWEHHISDHIIRDKKVKRLILREKIELLEKHLYDT